MSDVEHYHGLSGMLRQPTGEYQKPTEKFIATTVGESLAEEPVKAISETVRAGKSDPT